MSITADPAERTGGINQKTEQMRLENGLTVSLLSFVVTTDDACDLLGMENYSPNIFRTVWADLKIQYIG